MSTALKKSIFPDKALIMPLAICFTAFLLPALKMVIGGQKTTQYLLTAYPGWIVLAILLLYTIIQGFFFYKKSIWNPWLSMLIGLYAFGFAILQIRNGFLLADINRIGFSAQISGAPWVMAAGSLALFTLSVIKIIERQRTITATFRL